MQDTWWNHSTDKLILLFLVCGLWGSTLWMALHIFHHDDDSMVAIAFISFMTGSVSTVLGALVMILTGRSNRADGQTANGAPPTSAAIVPGPLLPPKPAPPGAPQPAAPGVTK